jgi:hypothetical protein
VRRERDREFERDRWGLRERSDIERSDRESEMPREKEREIGRQREIDEREREGGPHHWWVCAVKAGGAISGGTQADFQPAVEDP